LTALTRNSDEEEEDELTRELNKIRAERAAAKAKEDAKRAAAEQAEREQKIAVGNPLLSNNFGAGKRYVMFHPTLRQLC